MIRNNRPTTLSTIGPIVIAAISVALISQVGCGERKKKKKVNLFSQKVKVDYSQVKVPKPPPPVVEVRRADTWATRTQDTVKKIQNDLVRCRTEFLAPFQFGKMRRRDVQWLSLGEMDRVCREGDGKKKRGPWRLTTWLAKEQIGKHPTLDRYVALALDQGEHFRIISLMAKKVGAPEIALVTETAKNARDRAIAAGMQMDNAAREIAAWQDSEMPHDDPALVAKALTPDEYAAMLGSHYSYFFNDTMDAYDRFAAKSWKHPNMIKFKSLRAWADIPTKHLQQDRARLTYVKMLDDKRKAVFEGYLVSVESLLTAWRNCYKRYVDNKSGTWSPKDPYRRPLQKAQKAWKRQYDKHIRQHAEKK